MVTFTQACKAAGMSRDAFNSLARRGLAPISKTGRNVSKDFAFYICLAAALMRVGFHAKIASTWAGDIVSQNVNLGDWAVCDPEDGWLLKSSDSVTLKAFGGASSIAALNVGAIKDRVEALFSQDQSGH